jgi:hypothetical protein
MKKLAALFVVLSALGFNPSARAQPFSFPAVYEIAGFSYFSLSDLAIKSKTYNEADDPLFRRGTQNTDTPQGMFFVLPMVLTVFFVAVLLYKRK